MTEIFKPIPGYPGYEASQLGRIKGPSGKILSQRINPRGYLRIGDSRRTHVHKMILLAWRGSPPLGYECCHGPRGKLCNEVTNLRWGTKSENAQDRVRAGNHGKYKGKGGPIRAVIRDDGKRWENASQAALAIGTTGTSILRVCEGRLKTCKGYTWRFDTDRPGSGRYRTKSVIREDGKQWSSVREAAREMGVQPRSIREACSGRSQTCKGYTWRFAEEPFMICNCYLIVAYI